MRSRWIVGAVMVVVAGLSGCASTPSSPTQIGSSTRASGSSELPTAALPAATSGILVLKTSGPAGPHCAGGILSARYSRDAAQVEVGLIDPRTGKYTTFAKLPNPTEEVVCDRFDLSRAMDRIRATKSAPNGDVVAGWTDRSGTFTGATNSSTTGFAKSAKQKALYFDADDALYYTDSTGRDVQLMRVRPGVAQPELVGPYNIGVKNVPTFDSSGRVQIGDACLGSAAQWLSRSTFVYSGTTRHGNQTPTNMLWSSDDPQRTICSELSSGRNNGHRLIPETDSDIHSFAASPDGSRIVFGARRGEQTAFYLVSASGGQPTELPVAGAATLRIIGWT